MSPRKSRFSEEVAIIPNVARVIAGVLFAATEIGLLGVLPHYAGSDLPPMPWWALICLMGGAVFAVIVLMVGYVNADSKRRGMNSLLWTLVVIFVPKALGFLLYFLMRKPLLAPCPQCGTLMASDFRYCQKCGYAITPSCQHCGHAIKPGYVCCPYCGKPVTSGAGVAPSVAG